MSTRTEHDTMGQLQVASDRDLGAQTERSINNFPIGRDTFVWGRPVPPRPRHPQEGRRAGECGPGRAAAGHRRDLIRVLGAIGERGDLRQAGHHHFPLVVFQTGSGTQSNMNANEVISNRAIEMAGGEMGSKEAGAHRTTTSTAARAATTPSRRPCTSPWCWSSTSGCTAPSGQTARHAKC